MSVTGDPTPTDNCVLLAFKASTAFFARYDRPGTDSRVALGIARNSAGQTTYFHYDSDPCGGSSCGAIIDSIGCDGPSLWPDGETRPRGDPPIKCSAYKANARICQ